MKRQFPYIVALCLLLPIASRAQFYTAGNDQGSLRWKSIRTEDFKLIYPNGADSLARIYAYKLEQYKYDVGRSAGAYPNQNFRRPLPVVLHVQTAHSNGSVNWLPQGMNFYTLPDALSPDVLPWEDMLAIHESRHAAQLQLAGSKGFKGFRAVSGDLFGAALSALYPSDWFLEGDAVVAETGLTASGRGRSADFLEYYRAAFDEGDFRNWYRWRYGSYRHFTPDHYKIGYLTLGGARYLYDEPNFSAIYFDNTHGKFFPLAFDALNRTLKQVSGKKLKAVWNEIAAAQDSIWKEDIASRGEFAQRERVSPEARRFTQYTGTTALEGQLYSIRKGIANGNHLVRIGKDGSVSTLRPFASMTSALTASASDGRIYWSEVVPDRRWSLKGSSRICFYESNTGATRTLTREGRLYNPAPNGDGSLLSVTGYPQNGGSEILVLDSFFGNETMRYKAPDHIQVVESAWLGDRIVASGLSEDGFGIYDVSGGFSTLLEPRQAKIKQLRSQDGNLYFVSDRSGVNELYRLNASEVVQLSNNRLGASDFVVCGDSLYFSALTAEERAIYKASINGPGKIDYGELYKHPIAETLSMQEAALAAADGKAALGADADIAISDARSYNKLLHLIKLHSWLPLYVDFDETSNLSFETLTTSMGAGATAFFQNELGTAFGSLGVSATRRYSSLTDTKEWRPGVHARFTYTGRYPVLKLSADLGNSHPYQYMLNTYSYGGTEYISLKSKELQRPSASFSTKVYVPFNFSGGGWQRGFIPQIKASLTNSFINTTIIDNKVVQLMGEKKGAALMFNGLNPGEAVILGRVTASVRAYSVLTTPSSRKYPRFGAGGELGYSLRPALGSYFTPDLYFNIYGYLPGVMDTHGMRLALLGQYQFKGAFKDPYLRVLPRGFSAEYELNQYLSARYPIQAVFNLDYDLPLVNLDWAGLGRLAYIKSVDLRPHLDFAIYSGSEKYAKASLFSVGSELCLNLGNLAWIPYDTRIGLTYSFNGGSLWADMTKNGVSSQGHHHIGFVFSINL